MTFRDVEDSIRPFNGDEKCPIDFEETAELFECAELHRQMDKRKIKKDESIQAYFLAMKEITSRGETEEETLFQYVIDGMEDQTVNKSVLYGARNAKEFKEKLKVYEKMRMKTTSVTKSANAAANKKVKPKEDVRCFNCGEIGHRSTMCDSKSKGTKCFKCNEFFNALVDTGNQMNIINQSGPYRITRVKPKDTYDVIRVGDGEGPVRTITCAEYLKQWINPVSQYQALSGFDNTSGRPNVGSQEMAPETGTVVALKKV
ncbi:hypothetical protein ALC60_01402 [Trachymyrmex zeteki]|uniref:CCHC-type domain-containing protein n=1 Tax=Mycetomoellerius zeteki TaxID=64791 RepID=A0A151XGQ1_9HYME|nr:hypothetical protein ALC60_01402 [Trachymyrmex zeteki]